jgi:hypothetical protein
MADLGRRPDRVAGRPLSPRAFRAFGIEAVLLGPPTMQDGLVRREGIALWRRLPSHAPVFDRAAADQPTPNGLLTVPVVVATTPSRDRALRVPALGDRAARITAAAAADGATATPPPDAAQPAAAPEEEADPHPPTPGDPASRDAGATAAGLPAGPVLLVDEGPGETWLYLAEEADPAAALAGFLGRRGRTDFALARRRSRVGGLASVGLLLGLLLVVYAPALGLGVAGQLSGAAALVAAVTALVSVRPRRR